MANKEHLAILEGGVDSWNKWRLANAEVRPILSRTRLKDGDFRGIDFRNTDLTDTDLSDADLRESDLRGVLLSNADLTNANLRGSNLNNTILVNTKLHNADISESSVCGLSLIQGDVTGLVDQALQVSYPNEPYIAVDGLALSQFVHRVVHDDDAGVLVNDYREKAVLLVGAFTKERRKVRKALQQKLRDQGYLPVVLDYSSLEDPGVLAKMHSLAAVCRFIIADVTGTATLLSELREFIPSLNSVIVQPIAYSQEVDPAGFEKYKTLEWMLPLYLYNNLDGWDDLGDVGPDEDGNPQVIPLAQVEEETDEEVKEPDVTIEKSFVSVGDEDIAELAKTYEDFLDALPVEMDDAELTSIAQAAPEPLVEVLVKDDEDQSENNTAEFVDIPVEDDPGNGVYEIHDEYHEADLNGSMVSEEEELPNEEAAAGHPIEDEVDWPGTSETPENDEPQAVDAETVPLDPENTTVILIDDPESTEISKAEESEEVVETEVPVTPDAQLIDDTALLGNVESEFRDEILDEALEDVAGLEELVDNESVVEQKEIPGLDESFLADVVSTPEVEEEIESISEDVTMVNPSSPAHMDELEDMEESLIETPSDVESLTEEEPEVEDLLDDKDDDDWGDADHHDANGEPIETVVTVIGERERRRSPKSNTVPVSLMLKRAAVIVGFLALLGIGYWFWKGMHRDMIVQVPTIAKAHVFVDGEKLEPVGEQAGKQSYRLSEAFIGKKQITVYPTQVNEMEGLEFVRYKAQQMEVDLQRGDDAHLVEIPMDLLYSVRKVTAGKYPNISPDGSKIIYVKPVDEWTKKIWFKDVYIHNLKTNKKRRITGKNEFFYDWDRPHLLDSNKHAYLTAYNSGGQFQYFVTVGIDSLRKLPLPIDKSRFGFLPLKDRSGVITDNKVYDFDGKYIKTLFSKPPFNNQLYYAGENGVLYFKKEKTKSKRTLRLTSTYVNIDTGEEKELFSIVKNNAPFLSASDNGEKVVVSDYTGLNIGFMTSIKLWQNSEFVELVKPLQDGAGEYKDGTTFHKTEACATSDGNKIVFEYNGDIYLIEIPAEITMQDLKDAELKS
ncbi:MAG: pentapeptide repeat-containing protein [Calditrichota bacterium]